MVSTIFIPVHQEWNDAALSLSGIVTDHQEPEQSRNYLMYHCTIVIIFVFTFWILRVYNFSWEYTNNVLFCSWNYHILIFLSHWVIAYSHILSLRLFWMLTGFVYIIQNSILVQCKLPCTHKFLSSKWLYKGLLQCLLDTSDILKILIRH